MSEEVEVRAAALHRDAIVIDAVCPLLADTTRCEMYRSGGVDVVAPTVDPHTPSESPRQDTLDQIARWHALVGERDDLLLVRSARDVTAARRADALGVYFHLQGTAALEGSLEMVDVYAGLGVGMIQLAYNVENPYGCGCEVADDGGLTALGAALVERLDERRVIVDCSHTGARTTLDAIERASGPVVVSHANARKLHPVARNVPDEVIDAVAAVGGVIGVCGYPGFVGDSDRPTLDDLLRHVDHIAERVGVAHVGLGLDYFTGQEGIVPLEAMAAAYEQLIASGKWSADTYPPPPYRYPAGIETPDKLAQLTAALLQRSYRDDEVRAILGENWLRVFREVWGE